MTSRASTEAKQGRNKLISANASSSPKTNSAAQVNTQSHESELSQSSRRHSPPPLSPPPPPPSPPLPTWTVNWVTTINDKESLKGASQTFFGTRTGIHLRSILWTDRHKGKR